MISKQASKPFSYLQRKKLNISDLFRQHNTQNIPFLASLKFVLHFFLWQLVEERQGRCSVQVCKHKFASQFLQNVNQTHDSTIRTIPLGDQIVA